MAVLLSLTILLLVCSSVTTIDVMRYASVQYSILYNEFVESEGKFYPSDGNPLEREWHATTATSGWTQGFFPGVFWNLVEYNATREELKQALDVTLPTAPFAKNKGTHDVGFVIMSGFGNAYRLLKQQEYLDVVVTGAHSLATRYSPIVRCTRSWDSEKGFLVIIDNMMNLEILFEAANQTNNQTLYNIGWQHANRTMYEHFRENNSTYHIVEYNETDGNVIKKHTGQGYADWSTWARGQSWSVHGFTIAYRYTKHQPFLDKAIGAANYVLTHLPSSTDLVPYWDYDAPHNSTRAYEPRDTSAAAIFASALVELSQYAPTPELKDRFLTNAKAIVDQLSSPKYGIYGDKDYKLPALIANGTMGPYPSSPYNVALEYGDYYLTQAVVRLAKL
jgi:unsaturated chondroitin disaccharide hydrolase